MSRRRAGLGWRHFVLGGLTLAFTGAVQVQEQGWKPLPAQAESPAGNPTTREKVELGKKLFFDPRLSVTGTVSCNSCHNVMEGGDDGRPSSMGVHGRIGPRNAPTVWNAVFQGAQFWDGRAPSLEEQAKGPIVAGPEMGMPSHDAAIERVRAIPGYVQEFRQVFGGDQPVTIDNAAKAIAAFERTLVTPGSPYDRFAQGDSSALDPAQKAGLALFRAVGCVSCHSGPAFNGPQWNRSGGPGFYRKFPAYTDNEYVKAFALDQDPGRAATTGSAIGRAHVQGPDASERGADRPLLPQRSRPHARQGRARDVGDATGPGPLGRGRHEARRVPGRPDRRVSRDHTAAATVPLGGDRAGNPGAGCDRRGPEIAGLQALVGVLPELLTGRQTRERHGHALRVVPTLAACGS
jgi:cytochrome c peroxidase